MAEIIKDIIVDVAQSNIIGTQNYITAKQGDKGSRFVRAKLVNEGVDITIDPTATVMLNAYKPDGTRADKIGNVNSDGSVTAEITSQMLAKEGQVDCDISIIDKDGTKLTTTTFFVQVQPASIPDGSIVSSDDYSVIADLLLRVHAVDENETARQEAEIGRIAENERVEELINSFVGDMPIANTVTPGAVKAGGDIVISSSGTVTVPQLGTKLEAPDLLEAIKDIGKVCILKNDNELTTPATGNLLMTYPTTVQLDDIYNLPNRSTVAVKKKGTYLINVRATFSYGSNQWSRVLLFKNGVQFTEMQVYGADSGNSEPILTNLMYLNANDKLSVYVFSTHPQHIVYKNVFQIVRIST